MYRSIPLLCCLFVTLSCQSLPEVTETRFPCQQLDWYELGRSLGSQGKDSLAYQERKQSCEGFTQAHHQRVINGWYVGVDEFCTPLNGFAFGRSGETYVGICPQAREKDFLASYLRGRQIYQYETDNQTLREELTQLNNQMASTEDPSLQNQWLQRIKVIQGQMEVNRNLISRIQEQLEAPTEQGSGATL